MNFIQDNPTPQCQVKSMSACSRDHRLDKTPMTTQGLPRRESLVTSFLGQNTMMLRGREVT